jgi:hypothetical protein
VKSGSVTDGATKATKVGLISSYGLFWKRDQAEWEKAPGFRSELRMLGRRGHTSRRQVADFYHLPGLYILYGRHGAVYVGTSGAGANRGVGKRIHDHVGVSDRLADKWDEFSWFGYGELERNRQGIEVPTLLPLDPIPHKWAIRDFEAAIVHAMDVPHTLHTAFRAPNLEWEQVRRGDVAGLLEKHKKQFGTATAGEPSSSVVTH